MTLARGSQGTDVKELQKNLKALGFDPGVVDGSFGSKTEGAVLKFQAKYELKVDGLVGSATLKALHMLQIHKAEPLIKLSASFAEKEFACHGDGLVKVDPRLITKLEQLRKLAGKPIIITSGYRSPEYNKIVGGALKSQHMIGTAADIQIRGLTPAQIAALAEKVGVGGIGIYKSWVHVDVRSGKARWNFSSVND